MNTRLVIAHMECPGCGADAIPTTDRMCRACGNLGVGEDGRMTVVNIRDGSRSDEPCCDEPDVCPMWWEGEEAQCPDCGVGLVVHVEDGAATLVQVW